VREVELYTKFAAMALLKTRGMKRAVRNITCHLA